MCKTDSWREVAVEHREPRLVLCDDPEEWEGGGRKPCLIAQLCPTLCNPVDCSPPGPSVHGILQARILEWLPFPPPGDLPNPEIKPRLPAFKGRFFTAEPPGKPTLSLQGHQILLHVFDRKIHCLCECSLGLLLCPEQLCHLSVVQSPESRQRE